MSGTNGLDLSGETVSTAPGPSVGAAPYDPAQDREHTRGTIAFLLIWLLIGVICILFVAVLSDKVRVFDIDKVTATILTPVVGLVGTVIGFYFGEKSK